MKDLFENHGKSVYEHLKYIEQNIRTKAFTEINIDMFITEPNYGNYFIETSNIVHLEKTENDNGFILKFLTEELNYIEVIYNESMLDTEVKFFY